MPIVDGRYEAKISTVFGSVDEAVEEIKGKLKKARRVRISNIPMDLLEDLVPMLEGKDVRVVLPMGKKPTSDLRKLGDIATTKARIYKEFNGKEVHAGTINFADRIFSVSWVGDQILGIDSLDHGKCVKCMNQNFDGGWRYAEKHK
jgi:hypothetical protein